MCELDSAARTLAVSVDGGAPAIVFEGLPTGRILFPAVFVCMFGAAARVLEHYSTPHVGFALRTRMMCHAGRASASGVRIDAVAWLCERAPLWVVVRVCALLRHG